MPCEGYFLVISQHIIIIQALPTQKGAVEWDFQDLTKFYSQLST